MNFELCLCVVSASLMEKNKDWKYRQVTCYNKHSNETINTLNCCNKHKSENVK